MSMFADVTSAACARQALDILRAEFARQSDPAIKAVLIRVAERMLELNDWDVPESQQRIIQRMKEQL